MTYVEKFKRKLTHHNTAHLLHIGIYVLIAAMYIWLTIEYGKKTVGKNHKPQYSWIGGAYVMLALVVIYELYTPSGHGDHSKHNDHVEPSTSGNAENSSLLTDGNKGHTAYY